ncbi:MAG TPA: hypothetical protein GX521_04950, partial [Firmicutes bacterium]|nr:hypothetical protein [Bacillota bacterium]
MMRKTVGPACIFLLCLAFSFAAAAVAGEIAAGCSDPLPLPADKVMRISEAWVEFEHHGSLPIAQEAQSYHHWEQLVFEVPLAVNSSDHLF